MEERTGRRGQNESQIVGEEKRNGRLVGAAETSKECAGWRRLQRKNFNKLGLLKRKRNRAVCREYQIMTGKALRGFCANQQPPQYGGAVPDLVWVRSKWLLGFPRISPSFSQPSHYSSRHLCPYFFLKLNWFSLM